MNAAPADMTNTHALGHLIYTDYIFLFQAAGMVLLVAMIGAIVLTHREKTGLSRRQNIAQQIARAGKVEMQKVPSGAGLGEIGILRPLPPEPKDKPKAIHHADHGHGGGHH